RRKCDAQTRAWRFVHLPVNERDLGFAQVLLINDASLAHLGVKIVSFTRALAHARENRETAVVLRDVVDQLEDDHCLADAGATECADLAALGKWTNQIYD